MGLALTTAISGVTGSWAITNETDSVTETVALPAAADSPLHWVTLFENEIHTVGGPSFPLSRLDVTLLDGRLHFSTIDPSLEFSFAATPSFLQDNFFASSSLPNVDIDNPHTAPRANAYGWYGSRHALEDLRRPVLAEDVARPSSGGGVEVATLGSRTDRRLEIAYYGAPRAGAVTEALLLRLFYDSHMTDGQQIRYHPAGETLSPYDDLTAPYGYHTLIRTGPPARDYSPIVANWYGWWRESFIFAEIEP